MRKPSAAEAYEKIALLEHRLNEALEQQAADVSEVLQVISSSPGELEPVFQVSICGIIITPENHLCTWPKVAHYL